MSKSNLSLRPQNNNIKPMQEGRKKFLLNQRLYYNNNPKYCQRMDCENIIPFFRSRSTIIL